MLVGFERVVYSLYERMGEEGENPLWKLIVALVGVCMESES